VHSWLAAELLVARPVRFLGLTRAVVRRPASAAARERGIERFFLSTELAHLAEHSVQLFAHSWLAAERLVARPVRSLALTRAVALRLAFGAALESDTVCVFFPELLHSSSDILSIRLLKLEEGDSNESKR
jgi:hypothetical protein